MAAALVVAAVTAGGVWAWRAIAGRTPPAYVLAPESRLASWLRGAPADVREAYRFAVANREVLQHFPCFCGCFIEAGHTSNANCYIRDIRPDGAIDFDDMSLS